MSQSCCMCQFLSVLDFVDVKSGAALEDSQNDAESNGGFRGSDHHDEEREDVAVHLPELVRECDETQIHGVEHQLDRHEHRDDVAPEEKARDSQGEQDRVKVAGTTKAEQPGEAMASVRSPSARGRPRPGWQSESGSK